MRQSTASGGDESSAAVALTELRLAFLPAGEEEEYTGGRMEDQSRGPIEDAGTGSGHGICRGRSGLATAPAARKSVTDALENQPIVIRRKRGRG